MKYNFFKKLLGKVLLISSYLNTDLKDLFSKARHKGIGSKRFLGKRVANTKALGWECVDQIIC